MSKHDDDKPKAPAGPPSPERRSFFTTAANLAMAGGLVASYGTLAGMAGRFLYPSKNRDRAWMYVADLVSLKVGDSLPFKLPDGSAIVVARQGERGDVSDFVALSSVCPHLGCHVHWEAESNRFFCPCHNGAFDPSGRATEGPPAAAGQSLGRYPLRVDRGLLFIEVPLDDSPDTSAG